MADQVDFPDIYIDSSVGDGGVGSEADPYNDLTDINWTTNGDNSVFDYYDGSPDASVTINLKKDSEWRVQWGINADGTADYPITIQPYGEGADPIVNGSDLITGWTNTEGNIWEASLAAQPQQVWINESFGTREESYGGEAESLLDSGTPASNGELMTSNQDGHINFTWTAEAGTVVNVSFRWSAQNNKCRVQCNSSTGDLLLQWFDPVTGTHESDSESSVFTSEIGYEVDIYYEKSNVRVEVGSVEKFNVTMTHNEGVGTVKVEHSLASNNLDVYVYSSSINLLSIDGDWFWDTSVNKLYLYNSAGDPDSLDSPGIEASARTRSIYPSNSTYLVFDGICASKSTDRGLFLFNCSHALVKNCVFEWCWISGFTAGGGGGNFSDITFEDNVMRYNGAIGMNVNIGSGGYSYSNILVRRNRAYENGLHQGLWDSGDSGQTFTAGIKIFAPEEICENVVVEQNLSYDNGPLDGQGVNQAASRGSGIWLDAIYGSAEDRIVCRHNLIHDNFGCGVYIEIAKYCDVYSNVIYDCSHGNQVGKYGSAGVRIGIRYEYDGHHNRVYNNIIVGGSEGILVLSSDVGGGTVSYNIVKNNIVVETRNHVLSTRDGGDNVDYGTGNVYDKSCFGLESENFIKWGASTYSTYAAWISASGQNDNNIEADPSFTDPDNDDYTLKSDSPCIDQGENLGPPYNIALMPETQVDDWPDNVTTDNRDDY